MGVFIGITEEEATNSKTSELHVFTLSTVLTHVVH